MFYFSGVFQHILKFNTVNIFHTITKLSLRLRTTSFLKHCRLDAKRTLLTDDIGNVISPSRNEKLNAKPGGVQLLDGSKDMQYSHRVRHQSESVSSLSALIFWQWTSCPTDFIVLVCPLQSRYIRECISPDFNKLQLLPPLLPFYPFAVLLSAPSLFFRSPPRNTSTVFFWRPDAVRCRLRLICMLPSRRPRFSQLMMEMEDRRFPDVQLNWIPLFRRKFSCRRQPLPSITSTRC